MEITGLITPATKVEGTMFGFLSTPLWLTELSLSYSDRLFPLDRLFCKRNSFLVTTGKVFTQSPLKFMAKHFEYATGSWLVAWFGVACALGGVS